MAKTTHKCFVIMPFSETTDIHTEEHWTKHYEDFLKPIIEEVEGIEAYRSKPLRGDVLKEIITSLVKDPIVIADLTDFNPNVLWELGVRQSFKHGTVTIAETGTELPFDIGKKGTLYYHPTDHKKWKEFGTDLKAAISDCIDNPERPDSMVLDTIAGRGTLYNIIAREQTIRRLDALLAETEENKRIYEKIVKEAKENIERSENKPSTAVTVPFRTASIVLLISDRYIEEKLIDYGMAESFANWLSAYNNMLIQWGINTSTHSKWFTKKEHEEKMEGFFEIFTPMVKKAIKELKKQL